MSDLVLRVRERGRAGPDGDAVGLELLEDRRRHVLVVEGQDVAAAGERRHGGRVAVVADRRTGHDLRGGVVRVGREHPEPEAERDRRRLHHPRQLAAADDAHEGETAWWTRVSRGRDRGIIRCHSPGPRTQRIRHPRVVPRHPAGDNQRVTNE